MLSGPRLIFRGVTSRIFARLRKKAKQNGIAIARPSGEAVKDGVKIHWNYDPDAEMLEVECIHAPFWIDPACVNKKLSEEIELELGSGRAA